MADHRRQQRLGRELTSRLLDRGDRVVGTVRDVDKVIDLTVRHPESFLEGFVEAVAQEVSSFGIGVTIVEPGGARTEFRYGSAQVAGLMPEYDQTRRAEVTCAGRLERVS